MTYLNLPPYCRSGTPPWAWCERRSGIILVAFSPAKRAASVVFSLRAKIPSRGARGLQNLGSSLQNILAHIDGQRQRFEADLFELLRIPSVSADPAFAPQV